METRLELAMQRRRIMIVNQLQGSPLRQGSERGEDSIVARTGSPSPRPGAQFIVPDASAAVEDAGGESDARRIGLPLRMPMQRDGGK